MTNLETTSLSELMELLRREHPAWRMGQLISNVAGWLDEEIWDVEDEQLANAIRLHLTERRVGQRMVEHTA